MHQERRASPRIPVDVGVRRKGSRFFVKYNGDVSANGVFLNTAIPLPKGEKVEIEINLSGGEPVRLKGEVLAQRPEEAGLGVSVVFSDIKEEDRKRIEEYISSLCVIRK
ncbi:MAG: PilZ domain-containing protein [Deltaproteobacteria bacterium]|nr:PilZ domain-containing protein [Deltaproteobacteria bacterium]